MRRGRLPLTALRSFEAAGRHLSFTKAADELAVSQAAVSRQVRELETLLGLPLFERRHRSVVLTDAGARLLSRVTDGFDLIAGAMTEIGGEPRLSVVRVTCEPTFASMWLVQRLQSFRDQRPDIELVLDVDTRLSDLRAGGFDMAIRFSNRSTEWPRTQSRLLIECKDTPLVSPDIAATVTTPADLANHTLFHDDGRVFWTTWFEAAGITGLPLPHGAPLPDAGYAVQAAKMAQGVALMDPRFVADDLAAGLLVRPFDIEIPHGAYWLVTPGFADLTEPARAFADWLMANLPTLRATPA